MTVRHKPHHRQDRRAFLAGAGALGLAMTGAAPKPIRPGRIDIHHHIFPPQFLAEAPKSADPFRRNPRISGWSQAKAIEEMDANGIALSVLSFSQPTYWSAEVEAQRRLARLCNDFYAGVMHDSPHRFGLFAGLPPLIDVDGALKEIDYGYGALKAHGVRLMSSYGDKWLGDKAFASVFDELNRRKAVVFVHPDAADCCRTLSMPPSFIEYPLDTARTALSLWLADAFDRWPDIRIILSHGGGALPMVADRISQLGRPDPKGGPEPLHDALEQFQRLYVDTANAANPPALAAIRAYMDDDHILFGTDDPFISVPRQLAKLNEAHVPPALMRKIERGNALKLIPGLGA